jgi:hypothetical protein
MALNDCVWQYVHHVKIHYHLIDTLRFSSFRWRFFVISLLAVLCYFFVGGSLLFLCWRFFVISRIHFRKILRSVQLLVVLFNRWIVCLLGLLLPSNSTLLYSIRADSYRLGIRIYTHLNKAGCRFNRQHGANALIRNQQIIVSTLTEADGLHE